MIYEKRYLQFNELVFDGFDMLSDYDETVQFKGSSTAYSYGHGSYAPFKTDHLFVSEKQANMTITLKLKKLSCELRQYYVRFAEQELAKPGRLWAIKNNEIIWAFARVNNMRPVNNGKQDEVEWDVEFVIPGGVWHKADKQRAFLLPYNVCTLMECKQFEDYNPCATSKGGGDCCEACEDNKIAHKQRDLCGCCCEDDVTADMALCYHTNELQKFYSCDTPYQLKYDCEAAERFSTEPVLGQRLCVDDICKDSVISGQFYSETDIPTKEMTITLVGDAVNPRININGTTNVINGEYHGKLIIEASGDLYYSENDCCEPELLDPSVWEIPFEQDYGWTIYPQLNSIIVEMNTCCGTGGVRCVYIDHTAITM